MKAIAGFVATIIATSSVMTLGEPTALNRTSDRAYSEGRRACYLKCRYHSWSAGRCLRHCRARTKITDASARPSPLFSWSDPD